MNSEPSFRNAGIVPTTMRIAAAMTDFGWRSTNFAGGPYSRKRTREIGCFSSGYIFPTSTAFVIRQTQAGRKSYFFRRVKSSRMAGSRVMARTAAIAMAKFLVKASGRKRRPSCASSAKTGVKETAMTRSEKKLGRPTSWIAWIRISR